VRPETSRRLLLAAVDAFSDRGYNATTTREIAERAEMSSAALYVHYRSKAELLFEISRTGHEAVLRKVERALDGPTAPPERVQRFVEAFVSWHARNHVLARVIQYELRAIPPERFGEIRELRKRFDHLITGELERGIATRDFAVADVRTTALAILSLGIDVARWYTSHAEMPPEQLGAAYGVLVLGMTRGPALT
jgi:AcrR family transcriptional regulator